MGKFWRLNHEHEFALSVDKLTLDGTYPVPMPGKKNKREYRSDPGAA